MGVKRHLAVDARGLPLAVKVSAANVHDSKLFTAVIESIPPVPGLRGRPRQRPDKVHADKGYDYRHLRDFLRRKGIKPRIARRGIESSEKLGRHRWVVERSLAWLNRQRRLRVRYERRADIHEAFLKLGCCMICFRFINRFC